MLGEPSPTSEPIANAIHSVDAALADNRVTAQAFEGAERILGALRHETTEPLGRIERRQELACLLRRMAIWLIRSRLIIVACVLFDGADAYWPRTRSSAIAAPTVPTMPSTMPHFRPQDAFRSSVRMRTFCREITPESATTSRSSATI